MNNFICGLFMIYIGCMTSNCMTPIATRNISKDEGFDGRWVTRPAQDEEFPYSVMITMSKAAEKMCSGTIISSRWVLTAARCMYDDSGNVVEDDQSIKIYAGIDNAITDAYVQSRQSKKLEILQLPSGKNFYSLALIQIDPFMQNYKGKKTAPLSLTTTGLQGVEERTCKSGSYGLVEWGEPSSSSTELKKYVSRAKFCNCSEGLVQAFPDSQAESWICARHIYNLGVCKGDFGAALVCDATLLAVAIGIVKLSETVDSCSISEREYHDCQKTSRQSIYIDLCYYIPWINSFVPSVAFNTTPCDEKGSAELVHLRSYVIDVMFILVSLVISHWPLLI